MSVRPLDLQVNINSLIETSRDQASRQATVVQEQRTMDGHMIDDALQSQHKVNKTDEASSVEKLQDSERHFGIKTEAETEQEYSEDDKKKKKRPEQPKKEEKLEKKPEKTSDHILDYLA